MFEFLDKLNNHQDTLNKLVQNKLEKGLELTDEEMFGYSLTAQDNELLKKFERVVNGEHVPGFSISDFLATPSAKVLIPKVIIGQARKAADPIYLASKFYKKVRLKNGDAIRFPAFGVMRAFDVAEGQEINTGVSIA